MTKNLIVLLVAVVALAGCSDPDSNAPQTPDVGTTADVESTTDTNVPSDTNITEDSNIPGDSNLPEDTNVADDTNIPEDTNQSDTDPGPTLRPIGPRPVAPTPLEQGTLFAAPTGTGKDCALANPCDLYEATNQAKAGDVVFMRGGIYKIDKRLDFRGRGTTPAPPIFESYPGETAILDGTGQTITDNIYVRVYGDPVVLRLFEIRNMVKAGVSVRTSNNVLEGLRVYNNLLSGIHIHESYDVPSSNNNLITDCVAFGNSGAGYFNAEYNDGGNSDGISISSGIGNRIENSLVYNNSDDGIDTWRTLDSYVGYSISHSNGIANGNGQGIKSGGAPPSAGTTVEHSLSYSNKGAGFDQNSGLNVEFINNTSWDNGRGYWFGNDTTGTNNVAFEATNPANNRGNQTNNSWQREGTPTPLSTDPNSPDFLVPAPGFDDIGAHAGR